MHIQLQPTSESPLPPAQTLQTARETLLQIFREQFEKASTSRDAAATSRFFKLFPAIGWEAEGLQAYAAFVVDLVKVRPPASAKSTSSFHSPGTNADLRPIVSSPLYFITSLTALFESIAMIVDQHQPVVEKYYGTGKMASVLERLLQESDRVTKGLIDNWIEERSMKRKVCFHCAACNRYVSQRYSSLALRHCQLHLPNAPNILFSSNSKSNINYEHS